MKVCPVCKTSYDDDAETCENDGETLLDADSDALLPDNPELRDVIQVRPDEATSMIDLEAMEDKLRDRMNQKIAEDRERVAQQMEAAKRLDPDATGTLDLEALERQRAGDVTGDLPAAPDGGARHEPTMVTRGEKEKASDTQVVKRPSGAVPKAPGPDDGKRGRLLVPLIVAAGLVVALGVGGLITFLLRRGEPLTVISIPPGATVTLDGEARGPAPLNIRASKGAHTIELALDGYEPFKEVIEVPEGGLSFREPLKARPGGAPPVVATPGDAGARDDVGDAGAAPAPPSADELAGRAQALIEVGKLDDALTAVKALIKAAPDDPRGDTLLAAVADARTRVGRPVDDRRPPRDTARPPKDPGPAPADKQAAAKSAYEDGERAYQGGRLDDAKLRFKEAIQLDPRFYLPHRSIARIYEREGNDKQTRYHLKRYLQLGGPDADLKVRRWLESHP